MIELAVRSNFSFLSGASHPQELVAHAAKFGHTGIGIADCNTLAGIVRGFAAAKDVAKTHPGFRYFVGCRLVFADDTPDLIVYPRNRLAYGQLCRLLSEGKMRSGVKGACTLYRRDFLYRAAGFQIIITSPATLMTPKQEAKFFAIVDKIAHNAPDQVYLALGFNFNGTDHRRAERLALIAANTGVPLIAAGDVFYHTPERRPLQDVLSAIRLHTTVENAGFALDANAEKHLKSLSEQARLYRDYPQAFTAQKAFITPISFVLDDLSYIYPDEPVPADKTPQAYLDELVFQGAYERYGNDIPEKISALLHKELALIGKLDYAPYFLTVYDIVRFAKEQDILCQGRGSAANSAVCYCLGITNVNPQEIDLLFERFISEERKEPPDIDVDFEHERREEVMQYIYRRYGREKAAIVATVIRYRSRSAIRDVAKALGLGEDVAGAIAGTIWGTGGTKVGRREILQAGLDPENPLIGMAIHLAGELIGFPRHLSQHVGGFVLTRDRLDETVPIGPAAMENRTFIEWDKDDIDVLKLMKVDVLSLGMLTCIRKAFQLLNHHKGCNFTLYSLPREDQATYEMLQKGDSLGVFQVESRAQMNMLPRLKPRSFYDLVIEVAIVRPGPIQGDMVHPYLRRRNGEEEVTYPAPAPEFGPADELRRVLGKTMGVPLFQEQAMRIAIEAAHFSADEANQLRRAMATFRHTGTIHLMREKMVNGMVKRGYQRQFAENCFKQIEGFGEYGFPESHAASFAHLVYVSAWLKCHYPEVFAVALLNSQPMGFYAPAQIVRDAREHGVDVLPIDVNASIWDNTLEKIGNNFAVRLGFRQISGFSHEWADKIRVERLTNGHYPSVEELHRRLYLPRRAYSLLSDADCFSSCHLSRREALWSVRRLPDDTPLPLFAAACAEELGMEEKLHLPKMAKSAHVITDYETTRLSLKAHPVSFFREKFINEHISCCQTAMKEAKNGAFAAIVGLITVRQRPGSAKGVVFLTIEDESGIANIVVWPKIMARYRREVMSGRMLEIRGIIQRDKSSVTHLVARTIIDRSNELLKLAELPERFSNSNSATVSKHPRAVHILPRSRDFH